MKSEEYLALTPSMRAAVCILAYYPRAVTASGMADLLKRAFRTVTRGSAEGMLDQLVKKGFVTQTSNRSRYRFASRLPAALLAKMADDADAAGWWPYSTAFKTAFRREDDYYGFYTSSIVPEIENAVAEGIRHLARGTAAKASDAFRGYMRNVAADPTVAEAAAGAAWQMIEDEPNFAFVRNDAIWPMLLRWLNFSFLNGTDVRKCLLALHQAIAEGVCTDERICETFAALCVWTGFREGLSNTRLDKRAALVAEACRDACDGKFDLATKLLRAHVDVTTWDDEDIQAENLDNAAIRFLAANVCAAASKPEKLPKTTASHLMSPPFSRVRPGDRQHDFAKSYVNSVVDTCQYCGDVWKNTVDGKGAALRTLKMRDELPLVQILACAWDCRTLGTGREAVREKADCVLRRAKELGSLGWLTVARLAATLLKGYYDETAEAAALAPFRERGVYLIAAVEPAPEWKALLKSLRTVVKKHGAKEERESDDRRAKLFWTISLVKETDGGYGIEDVRATVRPVGGAEDGTDDTYVDRYQLDNKKVVRLMDEKDLLVAKSLQAAHSGYSSMREDGVVSQMCGMGNLLRRDDTYYYRDKMKPATPIEIARRKCSLEATPAEDGGVVLQIPEWALSSVGGYSFRKVDKHHYEWIEIPRDAQKLFETFRTFGANGRIVLPGAAMGEAAPLLEEVARILPLAEASAQKGVEMKRVAAASGCRVRLDFAEGVLSVRAVVLPVPENPNLALDPGAGLAEKVVVGVAGSYVLVRDLAAEAAGFAKVKEALADDESWYDGTFGWRYDDLAAAIAALGRLKAISDTCPVEWVHDRRITVANAPKSGVKLSSRRTADDWFRVEGSFELDDGRVLSVVEMLEAARGRTGSYVKLKDGDYVALSQAMARELDALNAAGRRRGDGVEIVKAAIPMLDGAFGGDEAESLELPDALAVTAQEIRAALAKRPVAPKTLTAELRPYQTEGYAWLSRLASCGFGSCLADDMGLGKTVQVIALLLERAKDGPSLVVAPSSVCGNWRRELERFAPTLRPVMSFDDLGALGAAKAGDVVIASYGLLLFHPDAFAAVNWNGLVLDEAQAIKNDASKRAKTVKAFHAKFRVAATGTPVENRLGELWSLFDFLNPGLLGPAASFANRFTVDGKATKELKRLVKPLILRRLKGDVLDDLPEKTEVTVPVVLGTAERTAYEGCRRHALAQLAEKAEAEGGANRMSILAELTRLRRFCCHPSLVLPGEGIPSAKMEALVELLEGLHESHHRALVFSQFTDYLAIVRRVIAAHGWTHLYLDGGTPTLEREKLVNDFQGGEGDFFLISLKAGGTGLNLTAANYVILLDPWWNPAVENQAADRAHRIGQKNPVTVYRLIASDTVEARVIELHREKLAIAEDVLDGTGSSSLTPAQLMRLFG